MSAVDDAIYDRFEYENCDNCGRDADGHMVGTDVFGHGHAVCKEDAY